MSVKSANDGLITNHEVLELIRERKQQRSAHKDSTVVGVGNSVGTGVGFAAGSVNKIDLQHRASVEIKVNNLIMNMITTNHFNNNLCCFN